jgi:hypothetical protein
VAAEVLARLDLVDGSALRADPLAGGPRSAAPRGRRALARRLMGIARGLRSAGAGVVRVTEAQSSGYGMPQSSGQRQGLPS